MGHDPYNSADHRHHDVVAFSVDPPTEAAVRAAIAGKDQLSRKLDLARGFGAGPRTLRRMVEDHLTPEKETQDAPPT